MAVSPASRVSASHTAGSTNARTRSIDSGRRNRSPELVGDGWHPHRVLGLQFFQFGEEPFGFVADAVAQRPGAIFPPLAPAPCGSRLHAAHTTGFRFQAIRS
jgi:hypothetical protein